MGSKLCPKKDDQHSYIIRNVFGYAETVYSAQFDTVVKGFLGTELFADVRFIGCDYLPGNSEVPAVGYRMLAGSRAAQDFERAKGRMTETEKEELYDTALPKINAPSHHPSFFSVAKTRVRVLNRRVDRSAPPPQLRLADLSSRQGPAASTRALRGFVDARHSAKGQLELGETGDHGAPMLILDDTDEFNAAWSALARILSQSQQAHGRDRVASRKEKWGIEGAKGRDTQVGLTNNTTIIVAMARQKRAAEVESEDSEAGEVATQTGLKRWPLLRRDQSCLTLRGSLTRLSTG